jgi:LmbE family N-acetylglucosaminyl deacetylase
MVAKLTALFPGKILIAIPHMDDGVLACGGTIAKLPWKERIHIVYATDGKSSPAPVIPWYDAVSPDLSRVRIAEAKAAMRCLGVPEANVHFLGLPDGRLRRHMRDLEEALGDLARRIEPQIILMPFRYDGHADHLALNHAITTARQQGTLHAELVEYFVYYRRRLLPSGDVRCYVRPQLLFKTDIEDVSERKRAALECFKSQITRYYPWQSRPNLQRQLLEETCRVPEYFMQSDVSLPGSAIFTHGGLWIRLAHRLEPSMKRFKDQAVSLWHRGFQESDGRSA